MLDRIKKVIGITISAVLVLIAASVGVRIYLHVAAEQRQSFRKYVSLNGPWAEEAIWESADGQAYLLSKKTNDEKIAEVTAYFYYDETWQSFRMVMNYGNKLIFYDEMNTEMFSGDFDLEDCVLSMYKLRASNEKAHLPPCDTYVFSKNKSNGQ